MDALTPSPATTHTIPPHLAVLNITWRGENGNLPDPVDPRLSDAQICEMVEEVLQTGGVPGIPADPRARVANLVIERFEPNEAYPYSRLLARPAVEFGGNIEDDDEVPVEISDVIDHWVDAPLPLGRAKERLLALQEDIAGRLAGIEDDLGNEG